MVSLSTGEYPVTPPPGDVFRVRALNRYVPGVVGSNVALRAVVALRNGWNEACPGRLTCTSKLRFAGVLDELDQITVNPCVAAFFAIRT